MPWRTRIKICCIASHDESAMAIACGADALGFVSEMPSGPGVISEDLIADLVRAVPPTIGKFLLTSALSAEMIIKQQRRTRADTIQICDRLPPGSLGELRGRLPGINLVQVVHVTGPEAVDEAMVIEREVNALLLDSGNRSLQVKELGGTGRTHDWALSREIREKVRCPVFLAGGLTPQNVAEAISIVRPFGVDVCSGVRSDGRLDHAKLSGFVTACHLPS